VLGDALGIHPIMSFPNGDSKVLSKVRGDKALIPAMLKIAQAERQPGTPYLQILGSHDPWNEELAKAAPEALGEPPVLACYIGGTISINSGPNVTGLIYYKKDPA
jgi:fatty acid-binding protein DegV